MKKIIYPVLLTILFACGPSKAELDQKEKEDQMKEFLVFKNSKEFKDFQKRMESENKMEPGFYYINDLGKNNIKKYKINGCNWLGDLNHMREQDRYLVHDPSCPKCRNRDSLMITSIMKSLLPTNP